VRALKSAEKCRLGDPLMRFARPSLAAAQQSARAVDVDAAVVVVEAGDVEDFSAWVSG
jgi:hypothetical protein